MIDVSLETGEQRRNLMATVFAGLGDDLVDRLKAASSILIKVNLVHHDHQPSCTHVDAVRGVLDVIREHTQATVYVGDAGFTGTKAAFRHYGYEELPKAYEDVHLVDLNDDKTVTQKIHRTDRGEQDVHRSKLATDVDLRISLSPMKLHRDAGVSVSVLNWVMGTVVVPPRIGAQGRVWARWPWFDEEGSYGYHRAVVDLFEKTPCDIAVVDGILATQGDGPVGGSVVRMHVGLAGMDPFAVDAVAATLMGIDPSDVGYLALASEKNLGVTALGSINVPPMLVSEHTRVFDRPASFDEKLVAWKASVPTKDEM